MEEQSNRYLRFGAPFSSHQVVQRDVRLPIWGWAEPSSKVSLSFLDVSMETRADADGYWLFELPPQPARSEGSEIVVTARGTVAESLGIEDVLVGDVWFCSGQSNMEMGLGAVQGGLESAKSASIPGLRLLLVEKTSAPVPIKSLHASWRRSSTETVLSGGWNGFSAIAFQFGKTLLGKTGVPIGLIQAAFGGAKIHPFLPSTALTRHPELVAYREEIAAADREWRRIVGRAKAASVTWDGDPSLLHHDFTPYRDYDVLKPATCYNAMIHPFLPFAVKGVLWYQGESDVGNPGPYPAKMKALAGALRAAFRNPELPLYFAQIAPWRYGQEDELFTFWNAQYAAASIPKTGIVCTADLGNLDDIHPTRKLPVGDRFASLALREAYGLTEYPLGGPQLLRVHSEEGAARLSFRTHGQKPLRSSDGQSIRGFELEDEWGQTIAADVKIDDCTLIVTAAARARVAGVRHAWRLGIVPNLTDESGIPAFPFSRRLG